MMNIALRVCIGVMYASLSLATLAREVTAVIISSPSGAVITDSQVKSKALGKTPLRVSVDAEIVDYKHGILQADRYTARWPSGAFSKVFTYITPVSETEFIYLVERPDGVAGENKDKSAGDAHDKKPSVAAANQLVAAKVSLWQQQVEIVQKQAELKAIESQQLAKKTAYKDCLAQNPAPQRAPEADTFMGRIAEKMDSSEFWAAQAGKPSDEGLAAGAQAYHAARDKRYAEELARHKESDRRCEELMH